MFYVFQGFVPLFTYQVSFFVCLFAVLTVWNQHDYPWFTQSTPCYSMGCLLCPWFASSVWGTADSQIVLIALWAKNSSSLQQNTVLDYLWKENPWVWKRCLIKQSPVCHTLTMFAFLLSLSYLGDKWHQYHAGLQRWNLGPLKCFF